MNPADLITSPQTRSVLAHLESGQSITPAQAAKLFGIMRLGARIHEMKLAGVEIAPTEFVKVKTRRGLTRVARYRLARYAEQPAAPAAR